MSQNNTAAAGTLILAATSIGCDADIPVRSLQMVKSADVLIFEEDRPARKILKAAGCRRDYLKFTEHQEAAVVGLITEAWRNRKKVLYMSDQGMPCLADPGWHLCRLAHNMGVKIEVIPGPDSVTAALAAAPFDTSRFLYRGFLARRPDQRLAELKALRKQSVTTVVLDTPYRLRPLLEAVAAIDRQWNILLAMDISGPAEQYLLGTPPSLLNQLASDKNRKNFVLVLDGRNDRPI